MSSILHLLCENVIEIDLPFDMKEFFPMVDLLICHIVGPTDTLSVIIVNKRRLKCVRNILTTIVNTVCEVAQGHIQLRYLISDPNLSFIMHMC